MSETNYKPAAHQDLLPYLTVSGAARLCDFVVTAFGAVELERHADEAGRVVHAEYRIGDSVFCIAEGAGEWKPRQSSVMLYVPDTDAIYASAMAAGGVSLGEPEDKPYGMRGAGILDPSGNHWYLATLLSFLGR